MKRNNNSPILLMGMHRSGTTLLCKILQSFGIFIGKDLDVNYESLFFMEINDWILGKAHCTWDNIYKFGMYDSYMEENISRIMKKRVNSWQAYRFFGAKNYWKYKLENDPNFIWGWKDPRNTITLDLWMKLFPQAKVIHIHRNPIDVAVSLKNRVLFRQNPNGYKCSFIRKYYRNLNQKIRERYITLSNFTYTHSNLYNRVSRLINLHNGIDLWEQYANHGLSFEEMFPDQIYRFSYEDFLQNPTDYLNSIFDFLEIEHNLDFTEYSYNINSDRRYAFVNDPELIQLYNEVKHSSLMKELKYDNILDPQNNSQESENNKKVVGV